MTASAVAANAPKDMLRNNRPPFDYRCAVLTDWMLFSSCSVLIFLGTAHSIDVPSSSHRLAFYYLLSHPACIGLSLNA